MKKLDADVMIVGAGPVGMTLAIDLGLRGVSVLIVEKHLETTPPIMRCNHIASRTMEIFRQLGFADEIRDAGLPDDYHHDIAFVTSMTGHELGRIRMPSREERRIGATQGYADAGWPTAEPLHRCNQTFFEPILRKRLAATPNITILYGTEIVAIAQDDDGVVATAKRTDAVEQHQLTARYAVGCEGGSSVVRRAMGARFVGDDVVSLNRAIYARAPAIMDAIGERPAWSYLLFNARLPGFGAAFSIDGRGTWLFNFTLPPGAEFESLETWNPADALFNLVGTTFDFELMQVYDWEGRRLVADTFHASRLFICGDAAHIWAPFAGYGMNAGIESAQDLAWQLAGVVSGWGGPKLLEAYGVERQPATEQVSVHVVSLARQINESIIMQAPLAELEAETPAGERLRVEGGREMVEINMGQFAAKGLNFGGHYDDSPIVCYDDGLAPHFDLGTYSPSTVPGCRTPHLLLEDGASLYDACGRDFALIRSDPSVNIEGFVAAAAERGVPFRVVDLEPHLSAGLYDRKLVLSRPDQHVAWRGDAVPEDVDAVIAAVSGW